MLLVENSIVPLHRKRRTKWYWIHLQLHLHWWFIFSWSTVPMTTDPWISNGRSHCRHWSIDKSASKKNYQLLQNGIARAKSCENWIFFFSPFFDPSQDETALWSKLFQKLFKKSTGNFTDFFSRYASNLLFSILHYCSVLSH